MSTLRVNKLENTNTSNGGISIDTSGHVSIDGANFPTTGPLSNRNLIINGAMQVAQRGTSFTGVTNTQFALDRFQFHTTDEATYTLEQSSESPAGFEKSLKVTVTTADSSIEANDYTAVQYAVEGYDTIPLAFGTTDAKYVTLSFWVRSSETGNFGLHVHNSGNNRDWDATYAVNSANTWEYKTITVPGDTAGTWLKNNGVGLKLWFSLLVGSTYEASAVSTSWGSTLALGVNGQVQLSSVLNATWQITGVQLEVGETATPFEHRSYGDELAKCQRYFQHSFDGAPSTSNTGNNGVVQHGGGNTGSTTGFIGAAHVQLIPDMRAQPLVTVFDLATPRNTNKTHRHIFGQAGSNNQQASISDATEKSFNVRSDSGVNASGIIFHWKAESEL